MSFQKVNTTKKYVKYADCSKGDLLVEGVYLGPKEGKYGVNYEFRPEVGPVVSLNGAGHLKWLLNEHAVIGQRVQVTYEGQEVLESGHMKGKSAYKFELAVDNTTQMELPLAEPTPTPKTESLDLDDLD